MQTKCLPSRFDFQPLDRRQVIADFTGENPTADAGALLLREVDRCAGGILARFASCMRDFRDQRRVEHSVQELLAQRVFAMILGYEDLNDHDRLCLDPFLALVSGKTDPNGLNRRRKADRGKPGASRSTLNRLEHGRRLDPDSHGQAVADLEADKASGKQQEDKHDSDHPVAAPEHRCFGWSGAQLDQALLDIFLQARNESEPEPSEPIILDFDATDATVHGHQLGRFYHGYYHSYVFLPLYVFCGRHLLCARLRHAKQDASAGALDELKVIVSAIRKHWPQTPIWVRGDSGFCRDDLMSWCEQTSQVEYILGLQKTEPLKKKIVDQMAQARAEHEKSDKPVRRFVEFPYETQCGSWSRRRRVVAKAEYLPKGENPRFIVTSLSADQVSSARELYEKHYCGRGEMENRIKEQQLDLFADRMSCHQFDANQFRLYLASMAYVLMTALRRLGLKGTKLETAYCSTIRDKLLKIGATLRVSVRRVYVRLSRSYPWEELFSKVHANLSRAGPVKLL